MRTAKMQKPNSNRMAEGKAAKARHRRASKRSPNYAARLTARAEKRAATDAAA